MLSRVAENVYWTGRYAERAESTARLVKSTYDMLLDLPRDFPVSWSALVDVLGCWELLGEDPDSIDKKSVTEVLVMSTIISSPSNPNSINGCILAARNNARNSRDEIPQSAWEVINSCYHYTQDSISTQTTRQGRIRFCEAIQRQCEQFIGIMMNSMERDLGYFFFRIGQMIERADMISRVIDAKATLVKYLSQEQAPMLATYKSAFWLNALDALEATQSFRKLCGEEVGRETVLRFLLEDERQPRTVTYCLKEMSALIDQLPPCEMLGDAIHATQVHVSECANCSLDEVTEKMDHLQEMLAQLHTRICTSHFASQYD